MTVETHGRAQSEVMGMILIIAITLLGITGVMIFGTQSLSDAQRSSGISSAEHSYTQLDSMLSIVALGHSPSQSVPLPNHKGANQYVTSAGWMNISIESESEDIQEINQSLGGVVYESGDTKIAYQGGGVWKQSGGGSTMVSPPEFHYRDGTLTLPLIVVQGEGTVTGEIGFTKADETPMYPTDGAANPVTGGNVTITVQSEYYEAWGRYFEQRTGGEVAYPGGERVRIRLHSKQEHPALSGSFGGFGVGGQSMSMGGFERFVADSYDSSVNPYSAENANRNARISSSDEVHFSSGGGQPDPFWINGTLAVAGDSVQPASIHDNIDEIEYNADVPELDGAGHIQYQVEQFEGEEELVPDGNLDGETVTVTAGDYYLDEDLHLENGAELALDTSGGEIDIRIDGNVEIDNSDITIDGGDRASIFTSGDVALEEDVTIAENAEDQSNLFWLYVAGDVHLGIDGGNPPTSHIDYTGVLYGPESEAFLFNAEIDVKGSFSVGDTGPGQGNQNNIDGVELDLHYDEALQDEEPFEGEAVIQLNYLHISVNEVTIEER